MPWVAGARGVATAGPQTQEWVQSEADKAWCKLTVPMPASIPAGEEAWNAVKQAVEATEAFRQLKPERERLTAEWLARLRARGDERSLAAADLIDGSEAAKRHLFDLARNAKDPAVYAWALNACSVELECGLSVERWVQLDPGNMSPWFMALNLARARQDPQAEHEALYQLAQLHRQDGYRLDLLRLRLSLTQARAPGLQMMAEHELVAPPVVVGTDLGGPLQFYGSCQVWDEGPERSPRGLCLAAAESMWNSASGTLELRLASAVASMNGAGDEEPWNSRIKETYVLMTMQGDRRKRIDDERARSANLCAGQLADLEEWQAISTVDELAWLRALSRKERQ